MQKGVIISIVVAVLLVLGGIYYYYQSNSYSYPSSNSPPAATPGTANNAPATSNNTQTPTSGGKTVNVNIAGFAFSPSTITINVGDSVIWTNADSASHTVTSDSGSELSSPTLSSGQTYSHTFASKGTYNYHCSFHSSMKAVVIVQ